MAMDYAGAGGGKEPLTGDALLALLYSSAYQPGESTLPSAGTYTGAGGTDLEALLSELEFSYGVSSGSSGVIETSTIDEEVTVVEEPFSKVDKLLTEETDPSSDIFDLLFGQAGEMASTVSMLKEQGLYEELQNMQQLGAFTQIGLEEQQTKYGISGGMAMAQAAQQQSQQAAQQQGIQKQISMLPIEEKMAQQGFYDQLLGRHYGAQTAEQQYALNEATLQEMLANAEMFKNLQLNQGAE